MNKLQSKINKIRKIIINKKVLRIEYLRTMRIKKNVQSKKCLKYKFKKIISTNIPA